MLLGGLCLVHKYTARKMANACWRAGEIVCGVLITLLGLLVIHLQLVQHGVTAAQFITDFSRAGSAQQGMRPR